MYLSIGWLHFTKELFPTGQDVVQEKVASCFAGIRHISGDAHTFLQLLHVLQKFQSLCQNIVDTSISENENFRD